jgi:cyclopropane fatty-acyl-phospholipid synthase-like methyltransferase
MRRTAPAAERNKQPIAQVLTRVLDPLQQSGGTVLEIASGTGQHVVHLASVLPNLHFVPSDLDPSARASIDAWRVETELPNVAVALDLDVCAPSWPLEQVDAIVCINMIHIAPWDACEGLMRGAGRSLPAGGVLYLYGPFAHDGRHTAPSNAAFDEDLRARDSSWGIRDLLEVERSARTQQLTLEETVPMPANNLSLVFRRL